MKKLLILLYLVCFASISLFAGDYDLFILKIQFPVKKSKKDKVRAVTYDIWGPLADGYAQKSKTITTGTNWADNGYIYAVDIADNTSTSALYVVKQKQIGNRATKVKENYWRTVIDGGMGVDMLTTNTLASALQFWKLKEVEAPK